MHGAGGVSWALGTAPTLEAGARGLILTDETDENGFTEKERAELETLMERHADAVPQILSDLSAKYSHRADLEGQDLGPLIWLAGENPEMGKRVLSYAAFWWSVLFALRARDASEG